MDRVLATLVSRAMRRGLKGEPLWLAVAITAWLLRRVRQRAHEPVWRGRIDPGQALEIRTYGTPFDAPDPFAEG